MHQKLLLALLVINLAGCGLFPKKETAILVPEVVNINPESLQPCKPLKELVIPEQDAQPFVTVLDNVKDNAVIYSDCAKKQDNSIMLLKKFSNTKKDTK